MRIAAILLLLALQGCAAMQADILEGDKNIAKWSTYQLDLIRIHRGDYR